MSGNGMSGGNGTVLAARLARLPLRSRLTLLTAAAVAVAVAVSALACWLLTRAQLRDEVDNSLRNVSVPPEYLQVTYANCRPTDPTENKNAPPSYYNVQIVQVDGSRCVGPNSRPVQVQGLDLGVARGVQRDTLHDALTVEGADVRVLTKHIGVQGVQFAVSVSRPLAEVNSALNTLAVLLAAVAGLGVVGAGTAGLVIARSGLKPVDRLTDAVEHVARTQDLAIRIPADGEDEIARLSRSFNSMTAALAASRDLQQQLIADAGHELRTPLTSLRTNIDLLVRSEQSGRPIPAEDRTALLASVKAQMGELAALIGDLQELSRTPEPGQSAVEVVALHDIVGSALERARLRGPSLTITADLDPWYVRGRAVRAGAGGGEPAGQRGEVQPGRRHRRGPADGRRADRARSRPRHSAGRTAPCLRAVLALAVRAQPAGQRPGAVDRGAYGGAGGRRGTAAVRGPRRHGGGTDPAGRGDASAAAAG